MHTHVYTRTVVLILINSHEDSIALPVAVVVVVWGDDAQYVRSRPRSADSGCITRTCAFACKTVHTCLDGVEPALPQVYANSDFLRDRHHHRGECQGMAGDTSLRLFAPYRSHQGDGQSASPSLPSRRIPAAPTLGAETQIQQVRA